MNCLRKYQNTITTFLVIFFASQYAFQNIPKVTIFHTNDGTVCTCKCSDPVETNGYCGIVTFTVSCHCNQDHIPSAQFPSRQLLDLFLHQIYKLANQDNFNYLALSDFITVYNNRTFEVFHPPQA